LGEGHPVSKPIDKTDQGQKGSNSCRVSIFGDVQNLTGHGP